jgi:ribosomal-protein-serine acetyltransferase
MNAKVEDTVKFVEMSVKKEADRQGITALIWHQGKIAGIAGQHVINWSNKKVSIGYWIGQAYEGKGLITRATEALTDHSIREDKLNRVEINIAPGNKRSCAVPERLGFHFEGTARETEWLYDHFVDHRVYSMLASDWLKR